MRPGLVRANWAALLDCPLLAPAAVPLLRSLGSTASRPCPGLLCGRRCLGPSPLLFLSRIPALGGLVHPPRRSSSSQSNSAQTLGLTCLGISIGTFQGHCVLESVTPQTWSSFSGPLLSPLFPTSPSKPPLPRLLVQCPESAHFSRAPLPRPGSSEPPPSPAWAAAGAPRRPPAFTVPRTLIPVCAPHSDSGGLRGRTGGCPWATPRIFS